MLFKLLQFLCERGAFLCEAAAVERAIIANEGPDGDNVGGAVAFGRWAVVLYEHAGDAFLHIFDFLLAKGYFGLGGIFLQLQLLKFVQDMALVGVDDLLLATSAQCSQRFGKRIGRDDPTAERGTEFGELVILVGKRVLAIFEGGSESGMATLQFNAGAQGKIEGFELLCAAASALLTAVWPKVTPRDFTRWRKESCKLCRAVRKACCCSRARSSW